MSVFEISPIGVVTDILLTVSGSANSIAYNSGGSVIYLPITNGANCIAIFNVSAGTTTCTKLGFNLNPMNQIANGADGLIYGTNNITGFATFNLTNEIPSEYNTGTRILTHLTILSCSR